MKTKQLLSAFVFLFFHLPSTFACSCYATSFCELVNSSSFAIAFKGKVIDNAYYNFNNVAIYIEVEKMYRGDSSISDTIKLYGGENSAGCQIDLLSRFPIGSDIIAAVGGGGSFTNPNAANENYWESSTGACRFVDLKLEDNNVIGQVAPGISSYPLEDFEEDFFDCTTINAGLENIICADPNLIIFPNPVVDKRVNIISRFFGNSIIRVNIYSTDGKRVKTFTKTFINSSNNLFLNDLAEGVHIIELINSSGNKCFRKILIL